MRKNLYFKSAFFFFLTLLLTGCGKEENVAEDGNGTENKKPVVIKQFPNLVVDSLTWLKAKAELDATPAAKALFNQEILKEAEKLMGNATFVVSKIEAGNRAEVRKNADFIYSLAVKWLFMEKPSDQADLVLKKLTGIIITWASTNTPTRHTPYETTIMGVYDAYSIIRNSIPEEKRQEIDKWIRLRANYFKNLELTGNLEVNNWSTIKLNFIANLAFILEDEALMNHSIEFFKKHIEGNLYGDGRTHDLDLRDAFAYHAYDLYFYAQFLKTVTLAKGKDFAVSLYNYENSKGGSVQKCVKYWEPYMLDPENNPHIEFQNTNWDGDKSRGDYMKPYNPAGTLYVLDELLFMESNCEGYIKMIDPSVTRYSWTF